MLREKGKDGEWSRQTTVVTSHIDLEQIPHPRRNPMPCIHKTQSERPGRGQLKLFNQRHDKGPTD